MDRRAPAWQTETITSGPRLFTNTGGSHGSFDTRLADHRPRRDPTRLAVLRRGVGGALTHGAAGSDRLLPGGDGGDDGGVAGHLPPCEVSHLRVVVLGAAKRDRGTRGGEGDRGRRRLQAEHASLVDGGRWQDLLRDHEYRADVLLARRDHPCRER